MPIYDRTDLDPIPTVPDNLDQKPVFGGLGELVKDVMVLELRHFLKSDNSKLRIGELPRIDKYAVALDVSSDPLETAVNLVRSYPDITEDMPLVAVMAATGQNLKLNISDRYVSMTIPQAKVVSTNSGPYALVSGQTLEVQTTPTGKSADVKTSVFKFPSLMFTSIGAATVDEVVAAINFQALYLKAKKATVNGQDRIELAAGGSHGKSFPNKITIMGGTAASALGFSVGATNQNYGTGKQAYERHCISANLTVGIEVVAESDNVRTELSDLLFDFFTLVMADRQYQFFGRSIFGGDIIDETYQIILKDGDISLSGEQEMPRPGDPKDKIYVNRINIPVTAIQYTDRIITNSAGSVVTPMVSISVVSDDTLPEPN